MRGLVLIARASLAVVAAMLVGCATGTAPAGLQFTPQSERAIVVIGVEGLDQWRLMSARLSYRGVDASGNFDKREFSISNGNGWRAMQPTEYFVVEVEPGAYVATGVATHTGNANTYATFCLGTVRFDAPAGQAVYVGNVYLPPGGFTLRPRPPRVAEAAAKLAEFPGVQQTLSEVEMREAAYPPSRQCDRSR
jgi:hypothetical protein